MDTDCLEFSRILQHLIKKFISILTNYVGFTNVEKSKVFFEVIKRSISISQGIKLIALNALTKETTGETTSDSMLHDKVKDLLDLYLQQDLMECAAYSKENMVWKCVTDDDLYESLYMNSISDKNTMASSMTKLRPSMSMGDIQLHYSASSCFSSSKTVSDLDCLLLSSQFDEYKNQFQEDLNRLKSTLRNVSPSCDFKSNGVYSKSSCELVGDSRSTLSNGSNELDVAQLNSHFTNWLMFANSESSENAFQGQFCNSWEGKTKQFVPCHLYTSELNMKEAAMNVTDNDSQLFRCIYDTSTVSEDVLKCDILDLLTGIPSDTFLYDNNRRMFVVNSHVHLDKLSHESTLRFLENFIEAGNMFQKLLYFSKELSYYEDGLILRGLKFGIQQVLNLYTEYIMGVKVKKPSMQFLKTDVLEAAQSLSLLGAVCKIEIVNNNPGELPKGLGLLSYLKESLWSFRRKENAVLIGVILKFIYTPYFKFLEKWMDEGICYDPYGEFQILEDLRYLDRKDELYWKFAYTENSEDPMRIVPNEIKLYASDILQCGKNMRLLKICCPSIFSLEYMSSHPPPSISVLFSDCAARVKEELCIEYIKRKEEEELEFSERKKLSEDYLLIKNQSYISQREVFILNKEWCNRQISHSLLKLDCSTSNNVHLIERSKSWENVTYLPYVQTDLVYNGVGIIFTSCTFNSKDVTQNNELLQLKNKMQSELFERKISGKIDENFDLVSKSDNVAIRCQQSRISKSVSNSILSKSLKEISLPVHSDILPGTFMNSLALLLICDCGDTKEDVYSCLQLSSLQSIMTYNFKAVFDMRLHIVKKAVKDYFLNQLRLEDLLIGLKNTYLLLDESFSQLLCEKLFSWTLMCQTTQQFANWSVLNEIFCNSLTESNCASSSLLSTGTVIFVDLPENDVLERNEFLHFFQFEFQISWPLNIVIHKACIAQYKNIFSFLLELDFLSWLLGKTWESLMLEAKSVDIQDSSQYRAIMLQRFDLHQFISVLRNCIRHDIQGPVWNFLLKSLSAEELGIDALENIHLQYLKSVSTRCFLTNETDILHQMVKVMLHIIYKFCIWALNCDWEVNTVTKQYETAEFSDLASMTETYKKYEKAFYERLVKMTVTRKYGVTNDDGSKWFLETILESGRKCL